jgi:hypothetical protein
MTQSWFWLEIKNFEINLRIAPSPRQACRVPMRVRKRGKERDFKSPCRLPSLTCHLGMSSKLDQTAQISSIGALMTTSAEASFTAAILGPASPKDLPALKLPPRPRVSTPSHVRRRAPQPPASARPSAPLSHREERPASGALSILAIPRPALCRLAPPLRGA